MPRKYITAKQKEKVIARALERCEYCKSLRKYSPQPFTIDHIIPIAIKGLTHIDNLAFACGGCNGHKYSKINALDPVTFEEVSIFNPRIDSWNDHFEWSTDLLFIVGLTPIGRASVRTLHLNREELINLRKLTSLTGEHPPEIAD